MNPKDLTAERGKDYGHPLDDFARVAHMKAAVQDCADAEVRHALEMILVKVARLVHAPDHQDSIDDIQGYAETINMIHAERSRRQVNETAHPIDIDPRQDFRQVEDEYVPR